ncbi:hypothetical protein [Mesomycoplasma hyopneumoniae]|uniref:hypothetical protein n=1 Tax=Mesomycoplasma hyopneumoniae TaxID=2099 RepID=UPI000A8B4CA7|nr:hypothetical protein [Mesomycoplasma hyopneumoniae]UIF67363.1 hypothetical protein KUD10_01905 [Mesomycoplasma hyopneumoniae]
MANYQNSFFSKRILTFSRSRFPVGSSSKIKSDLGANDRKIAIRYFSRLINRSFY